VDGWVRQIQAGVDVERNFERLYKRFYRPLFTFFHNQRLTHEECEELTQETFLKVFEKIAAFEHRSSFSTWLWEIARNLFFNNRRRRKTAKREGIELPLAESIPPEEDAGGVVLEATEPSAQDEMERKEQAAALWKALSSLPPKMQRCAILRFQDNLKYREIAVLMRLNLDTVKAHLGHARRTLQEKLGPEAGRFTRLGREDEP
jgi:RNA polymerase sigma-70 factor (ECF subfamily)